MRAVLKSRIVVVRRTAPIQLDPETVAYDCQQARWYFRIHGGVESVASFERMTLGTVAETVTETAMTTSTAAAFVVSAVVATMSVVGMEIGGVIAT
jgi:hypothetical protein